MLISQLAKKHITSVHGVQLATTIVDNLMMPTDATMGLVSGLKYYGTHGQGIVIRQLEILVTMHSSLEELI